MLIITAVITQGKKSNTIFSGPKSTSNVRVKKAGDQKAPNESEALIAGLIARDGSRLSPVPISETETPSIEPESEPEGTAEAWPEPGPDWLKAYEEWGAAWEIHVYLFAVIFLGFAVYSAYLVGHGVYVGLNKKYLGVSLNVVMLILGFTRAFVLFTDPYLQGTTINNVHAMRVIWSLASPCLTSADCLVILALLETAKISLAPQKMQKFRVIIKIIILHFALVLISDFVVSEFVEAKAMLVFCQVFFIVWGSVLGVGYFALGYKLNQKLFGHKEEKTEKEVMYIRLIYASGVNNFILCAMFIYSSAGVFGVYSDVKFVGAWPWWAMQTCFRTSEVLSGILVFTVSAKRKTVKKKQKYEKEVEEDTRHDSFTDPSHQEPALPTAAEKDRKLSMFTHLHQTRLHGLSSVDPRRDDIWASSMITDLHEAKIEAYYAKEDDLHEVKIEAYCSKEDV